MSDFNWKLVFVVICSCLCGVVCFSSSRKFTANTKAASQHLQIIHCDCETRSQTTYCFFFRNICAVIAEVAPVIQRVITILSVFSHMMIFEFVKPPLIVVVERDERATLS